MLGWHVSVYTMVAGPASDAPVLPDHHSTRGLSLAQMDTLRDGFPWGDRIAVWDES